MLLGQGKNQECRKNKPQSAHVALYRYTALSLLFLQQQHCWLISTHIEEMMHPLQYRSKHTWTLIAPTLPEKGLKISVTMVHSSKHFTATLYRSIYYYYLQWTCGRFYFFDKQLQYNSFGEGPSQVFSKLIALTFQKKHDKDYYIE